MISLTSTRTTATNFLRRQKLVSIVALLIVSILLLDDGIHHPIIGVYATESDTLSANVLSRFWIDAGDVLDHLDDYRALWIKVHGCV